ncbi:Hypothetical predicted protein [Mytilus galloprovincialis]|uniref:Reverse transcriptase domain-containing protein n=2 Tax=Mytilus galloprovincialis TaxID=29158 RepID=A0A8B6E3Y3_MYTGA|nr:Hypothetical predicted protein [Mytilus galloprovincialis]
MEKKVQRRATRFVTSRHRNRSSDSSDFNARTGCDDDFVIIDENEHGDNNLSDFIENPVNALKDLSFPIKRVNMDKGKNRYGNMLLNFCKGNGVFILNGRMGRDQNIGRFTCRNASVVDYCISSPGLLKSFKDFEVLDSSKLLSDVHNPISVTFYCNKNVVNDHAENVDCNSHDNTVKKINRWDSEKIKDFQNNIDVEKIVELEYKLCNTDLNDVNKNVINTFIGDLCNIFVRCGQATFGISSVKRNKNKGESGNKNKPWFDVECKFARQNYRKLKRRFKSKNSCQNHLDMLNAEKVYKKVLDNKNRKFRNDLSNKIQNLRGNNPKEFWKILNKGKKKKQPDIDIGKLHDFFKNLNAAPEDDQSVRFPDIDPMQSEQLNENINSPFSQDEILRCIKKLKNDKACGEDEIINEYIKSTSTQFICIYEKLFNIIFDKGLIPQSWLIGTIKPVYKNKGDSKDPKNYRPITIVSCLGKLFTGILNKRLNDFSDEFIIIQENQSGFRQKYSTTDNIFTLYSFFELLKCKKKKLYCAFVDFEKAFDTVWRDGLFYKMLLNNINGKMYNVILNMYSDIKSRISYNYCNSEYFACDNGVRQGENLSPFLFSLFLNDLENFLVSKNITGLQTISEDLERELEIYLKFFYNFVRR